MNVIPNTNNNLHLAVAVNKTSDDDGESKTTDVIFVPIIAWAVETLRENLPLRITPLAVGNDNEAEGLKYVYNVETCAWYALNHAHHGNGRDDLLKLFSLI